MMLLVAMVAGLAACSEPTAEEMIEGTWNLEKAYETAATMDESEVTMLQGLDGQTLEFDENGYCFLKVQGQTITYRWYLLGDTRLVFCPMFVDDPVCEEYAIDELTEERLVYSDSYCVYDTVSGVRTDYTYSFEYSKQ